MVTPSALPEVELLERTDTYTVAAWRRLMLLVWRGQANPAGVERSRALFESWAGRLPGGAAVLIVIPGQLPGPPDEKSRAAMRRTVTSPEGPFRGMATLMEADGFIAATVRSIMTWVHHDSPLKVFRTVADAAAWAAELLDDPGYTPQELGAAIRVAREG